MVRIRYWTGLSGIQSGCGYAEARTAMYAPIGPLTEEERKEHLLSRSPLRGRYEQNLDRESAYGLLNHARNRKRNKTARLA
ncbi:MAG TPA: helicase HerA-like domain-containing protein [Gammaproteobacteria bacterium]